MKSDIKKYRFRGIYFYQDTLTYEEDQRVSKIISDTIGQTPKDQNDYSTALASLYDTGKLPEVFEIILKKDDRSLLKRILNRYFDRNNISQEITLHLKRHEIMFVLTDFFILRERWSIHYQKYTRKSVSRLQTKMKKLNLETKESGNIT